MSNQITNKKLTREEYLEKFLTEHLQRCMTCYTPLIEEPYYCETAQEIIEEIQKEGT